MLPSFIFLMQNNIFLFLFIWFWVKYDLDIVRFTLYVIQKLDSSYEWLLFIHNLLWMIWIHFWQTLIARMVQYLWHTYQRKGLD